MKLFLHFRSPYICCQYIQSTIKICDGSKFGFTHEHKWFKDVLRTSAIKCFCFLNLCQCLKNFKKSLLCVLRNCRSQAIEISGKEKKTGQGKGIRLKLCNKSGNAGNNVVLDSSCRPSFLLFFLCFVAAAVCFVVVFVSRLLLFVSVITPNSNHAVCSNLLINTCYFAPWICIVVVVSSLQQSLNAHTMANHWWVTSEEYSCMDHRDSTL